MARTSVALLYKPEKKRAGDRGGGAAQAGPGTGFSLFSLVIIGHSLKCRTGNRDAAQGRIGRTVEGRSEKSSLLTHY
jgi:hypothetical protein